MLSIHVLGNISDELYEEVNSLIGAGFYHQKPWHELLHTVFNWNVQIFVAYRNGQVVAALPFIKKYRIPCHMLCISLPISHFVTPAYRTADDLNAFNGWLSKATQIEIHSPQDIGKQKTSNYITKLDLKPFRNYDEYFSTLDKKSCRYMIKRATKENVKLDTEYSLSNFIRFERLEDKTRRKLGAPTYPRTFFRKMHDIFQRSNSISIAIAHKDGVDLAGIITLKHEETAIYGYGATNPDRSLMRYGANELVIAHAIGQAITEKREYYDFGTTPIHLPNLLKFKEKWNAESYQLPYTYTLKTPAPKSGSIKVGYLA